MDWKATLEEILAERRTKIAERPSPTEFAAMRAGELSDEERDQLLECASVDPALAQELFDVLRFPDLPGAEDEDGPEVDRRWRAFQERLAREGYTRGDRLPEDEVPGTAPRPAPGPIRWLPLAASFVLGALLGSAAMEFLPSGAPTNRPSPALKINLPIVELLPADGASTRGSRPVRLSPDAEGLVVTLTTPEPLANSESDYGLTIRRDDGQAIESRTGMKPGPGDVFVVVLTRPLIADGIVIMDLIDADDAAVASYRFEVESAGE